MNSSFSKQYYPPVSGENIFNKILHSNEKSKTYDRNNAALKCWFVYLQYK